MATAEEIFNSTKLEVVVPEVPLEIPEEPVAEDWLLSLANVNQRDKAFFDERLLLFLIVKGPHPGTGSVDPSTPPLELVQFLSHLQVTLDAKYIPSQQQRQQNRRDTAPVPSRGIQLALPPRSHSQRKISGLLPGGQLSIFPPHTPHPTPQTDEADRKYATSSARTEGTVLESFVWGETQREEPTQRSFGLLWSSSENMWVAIYRLSIGISFLRTPVAEPLLSLTVSTTLRDKPLKITTERQAIAALISAAGRGQNSSEPASIPVNGTDDSQVQEDELSGLEEVNLLDGLSQAPTFGGSDSSPLTLSSVRLGTALRHAAFSLPPVQFGSLRPSLPSTNVLATSSQTRSNNPILRKSFLKTLQTVSGFQIRMKSVFVPYVVIPGSVEDEEERREAGSEERTVVLSIELGNGSTLRGPGATGFAVEGVDVTVGGEGATANLIGWGENGFRKSDEVFPLLMEPVEQFNLLYVITFLRQSEADDVADTMRSDATGVKNSTPTSGDLQRPVSIVVRGRPFDLSDDIHATSEDARCLSYPTQTFRSRWNCVLDLLSVSQSETFSEYFDVHNELSTARDALPAPASPFPAATLKDSRLLVDRVARSPSPNLTPVAGSKRHTFGGLRERGHNFAPPSSRYRASTPILNISNRTSSPISTMLSPTAADKFTPSPPSMVVSNVHSPTGPRTPERQLPPATPAYPAYSSEAVPPTPLGQSPITGLSGETGPLVEPLRERLMVQGGTPQTPGPRMLGAFVDKMLFRDAEDDGDAVVVSVGAMPPGKFDQDIIYALDTFGIEIFVFNRSERTRRFEVSYPERKRRRQQIATTEPTAMGNSRSLAERPGILPLENRIRIGPLRPHTCQSVRMQFLALQPGVHSIHSLILSDVETGYSKNLKSVMDVIVHEID